MSIPSFGIDDQVVCNPDYVTAAYCNTVYKIVQMLRVNVVLEPIGGGKRLRINPDYLLPAPADGEIPTTVMVPYRSPLATGAVVTVDGPGWRGAAGLHVVLDDDGERTKIALLGGDLQKPYRYWKVSRTRLTEISRDELMAALAVLAGAAR